MNKIMLALALLVICGVAHGEGNDASTVLLLHFDEYPFTDSSSRSHTIDVYQDSVLMRSTSMWGNSAYYQGSPRGRIWIRGNSADFQFGGEDFTIDLWARIESYSASTYFFHYGTTDNSWDLYWNRDTNEIRFWVRNNATYAIKLDSGTGSYPTYPAAWHHIAAVRHGEEWSLYIDGILKDRETDNVILNPVSASLYMGMETSGNYWMKGYIDEVRISKGTARWTDNFDPPTAAYDESSQEAEIPEMSITDLILIILIVITGTILITKKKINP